MAIDDVAQVSTSGSEPDLSKYKGSEGLYLRWIKEIDLVKNSKEQRAFETIGERICKTFRNADTLDAYSMSNGEGTTSRVMYNVLWSNVKILSPNFFCRIPKTVVERRHKDSDPVGRLACLIAERATTFMKETQQDRYFDAVKFAVQDRLLPGRGVVWLRYDAQFEPAVDEEGSPIIGNDGQAIQQPKPNSEMVFVDYVHWADYFQSTARIPTEIRWKARRVWMNRDELVLRFGDTIGKAVKLDNPDGKKRTQKGETVEFLQQAEVFEIEDKASKKRIWVSKEYKNSPLDIKPLLPIKDVWSSPTPLLATTTTDSMYPTPDYKIYERLAVERDNVTKRIAQITDCIKVVGACAASLYKDYKEIFKKPNGGVTPIVNWAAFMGEKGGLATGISWFDFDNAVNALGPLTAYQASLDQQIDLITGIPEIMRGDSDPNKTASAIQRESSWITTKIRDSQAAVQRFCREIDSKMCELIFEPGLFADETIGLMCGIEQLPMDDQQNYGPALDLLRNDKMRTFRVDIETDSTIAQDEEAEKQAWTEYLGAVKDVIGEIEGVTQFRPELMAPIIQTAMAALRPFRTGKAVEGAWEKALQQIEDNDAAAAEAAKNQPPQPDPVMMKVQNDQQKNETDAMIAQTDAQREDAKQQFDQWYKQQQLNLDTEEVQRKVAKDQADYEINSQLTEIKGLQFQNQAQVDATAANLEQFKEHFKAFAESKLVQIDELKVKAGITEKALQENRLTRQEVMDHHQQLHDQHMNHIAATTDVINAHANQLKALTDRLELRHQASMDAKGVALPAGPE